MIRSVPLSRRLVLIASLCAAVVGCSESIAPPLSSAICTPDGDTTGFTFLRLGEGTKPAIALGSDGRVHAAFIDESTSGWIRYVHLEPGAGAPSFTTLVAEGYFYGPIELVLDENDRPHVLYHDHTRADQVLAVQQPDGSFLLHPMDNPGHDGWYNAAAFDTTGVLHTASYDPSGFSGVGVVYGAWDGQDWTIEVAAPGSFDYAGGMAIDVAGDASTVKVAFYDDVAGLGRLATRDGSGSWSTENIESLGAWDEVGRFPDLDYSSSGTTSLVYLAQAAGTGTVRRARIHPSSEDRWDVTTVTGFTIGFAGARDLATFDFGAGQDVVAYQTRSLLGLIKSGNQPGTWTERTWAAAPGITFGQQTEVVIGATGEVHLVWWQDGERPGTICYATDR